MHVPAQAPVPAHPARLPCGGPDATGLHVPTLPVLSHASHELVHARLQQIPSGEQIAFAHSRPAPHVAPSLFLAAHVPLLQYAVLTQSLSAVQLVRHAVADAQVKLLVHAPVAPGEQVPLPLHMPPAVSRLPAQDAAPQLVPLAG